MPNWTNQQKEAIEDRGSNLLIAAAAGSGKTAVLVQRIIQLITEDQIDVDRLLIVTFTNAAAGEMRERIANALLKELEKENENKEHLRRQITLLNRASITTTHSFCIDVVKKHFHTIDIDPSFRIGDISETNILKQEAMEETLETEYEKGDQRFFDLVESFGGNREDTQFQELIEKMYLFIQSQPKPMNWLREKTEAFNINEDDFGKMPWVTTLKNSIEIQLMGALDLLEEAKRLCLKPDGPEGYLNAIKEDGVIVESLLSALKKDIGVLYNEITNVEFGRLGRLPKDVNPDLKEQAKELRDKSKRIVKGFIESIFARSPEAYLEDLKTLYPLMQYLCTVINDFSNVYREKKLGQGLVDFNDLEHYALEILENDTVARQYRDKFAYIFIDEYQDSNIVQETLIGYIKRENNLFMVGDVKQSIYRFRLADPTLFIEKYESFGTNKGETDRRIDLSRNFRSREEIINGVNFLFKHTMSKQLGEIDYNEAAYLYTGGEFQPINDCAIEVNLIEKDYDELEGLGDELEELNDIEVEARIVSQKINALLNSEIYDEKKKEYRKVAFKDIVILMRTTRNWAHVYLETLIKENIPTYADVGTGYFESVEISILINLLRVMDNKRQDIPLVSLMRSPIGGFSIEELVEIRLIDKKGSFFKALSKFTQSDGNIDLKEKAIKFIRKLDMWAEEAKSSKIHEFIWKVFIETDYYHFVGAMPGGLQRQANLRILLDRAAQFEQTSIKGLFNFITFVEKLKGSKGDLGDAKTLGENDNVVRIMSIHKSKGLEFPVVILAGTGKNFNLRDTNASVILHKDLGIGPKFVDAKLRVYRDTIIKLSMKEKLKMESLSEEMRILYVALTRPVDKLLIYASVKNLKKQTEKWSRPINSYLISSAKSYIDWLGMVLTKHPQLSNLRQLAEINMDKDELLEDASNWKCNIYRRNDIIRQKAFVEVKDRKLKEELLNHKFRKGSAYEKIISDRLDWQYPFKESINIPSKLSVSGSKDLNIKDIARVGYSIPSLIDRPKFLTGKKEYSKAEKGTILHFIMQHLNLEQVKGGQDINIQIQEMIEKEIIIKEEVKAIELNKIMDFFNSSLGKRMLTANGVHREVSFNMKRKAHEVIHGLGDCDENLLINGTVDCYFEEEDYLILVDYKSDEITDSNTVNKMISKYEGQLNLYKEAIERIVGKEVRESYIYLFDINKEVKLKPQSK